MYIHVGKPAGSGRWSASARRAGRTAPRRAGGTERGETWAELDTAAAAMLAALEAI